MDYEWFEANGLLDELKAALDKQCNALIKRNVYKVVDRPTDRKIMSSRIIIGIKTTSDGFLKRVKCRYVPRGFAASDYRSSYLRRDSEVAT